MDRTGHTTSGQLNNYRRAPRTAEELGIGTLAALHEAIPELAAVSRGGKHGGEVNAQAAGMGPKASGSEEFRRRDSNPDKRIQNAADFTPIEKTSPPVSPEGPGTPPLEAPRWESIGNPPPPSPPSPASANPRAAAVSTLYAEAARLASAGDIAGARTITETILQMLDGPVAGRGEETRGVVIDLGRRRR